MLEHPNAHKSTQRKTPAICRGLNASLVEKQVRVALTPSREAKVRALRAEP
jgi:hypothetical protein